MRIRCKIDHVRLLPPIYPWDPRPKGAPPEKLFVGKSHFLVINDHLWVYMDKSFKKIQAGVRPWILGKIGTALPPLHGGKKGPTNSGWKSTQENKNLKSGTIRRFESSSGTTLALKQCRCLLIWETKPFAKGHQIWDDQTSTRYTHKSTKVGTHLKWYFWISIHTKKCKSALMLVIS